MKTNENFLKEMRYQVACAKVELRRILRAKGKIAASEETRVFFAVDFLDERDARSMMHHRMMLARQWKHLAYGGVMAGSKRSPKLPKKLAYGTKLRRA